MSLHTPDLGAEIWRRPTWELAWLAVGGDEVFTWPIGPRDSTLDVLDVFTGEVRRSLRRPEGSWLSAMTLSGNVLLVGEYSKAMYAIDARSGGQLWTAPFITQSVGVEGMFLGVDLPEQRSLRAVDAMTGIVRWQLQLPGPESQVRSLTVISPTAALVVLRDGRVFHIVVQTAAIEGQGRIPPRHDYFITDQQIIAANGTGLVVVDHRSMTEVAQVDWREAVERRRARCYMPSTRVVASRDCVLWLHCGLMGAPRVSAYRRPKLWLGTPPWEGYFPNWHQLSLSGRYVYSPVFIKLKAVGLCCFTSADPETVSARWTRATTPRSDSC